VGKTSADNRESIMKSWVIGGLVGAISICSAGIAFAQETYTLRLANWSSSTGAGGLMFDQYAKEVDAASKGRLKIEVFHGASLGPAAKHYDLVANGIADMAYFVTYATPGRFPMSDIFGLPNVMANAGSDADATRILMELAPEHLYPEFKGVRIVWLAASALDTIHTVREPVRTLDDIKGKRLRVTSNAIKDVLRDVGADPISVPAGDVAEALQKNSLDGTHGSHGSVWTLKLGDLLKYETPLLSTYVVVGMGINQAAYDKLPPDLREIVDGLGGVEGGVRYVSTLGPDNPVVATYIQSFAFEQVEPDPALVKAVDDAAASYSEKVLATYDAKGPEGRALFERVREMDSAAR
jgi:TRAP-type C4-dicarboxylate transport system substrate-binding protein